MHEVTSPQGFDLLRAKGVGVRRPERTLATILLANMIVNVVISVLATTLALRWFGAAGLAVAIPAVTLLLLVAAAATLGGSAARLPAAAQASPRQAERRGVDAGSRGSEPELVAFFRLVVGRHAADR